VKKTYNIPFSNSQFRH